MLSANFAFRSDFFTDLTTAPFAIYRQPGNYVENPPYGGLLAIFCKEPGPLTKKRAIVVAETWSYPYPVLCAIK